MRFFKFSLLVFLLAITVSTYNLLVAEEERHKSGLLSFLLNTIHISSEVRW
jgi:hypothetical protein